MRCDPAIKTVHLRKVEYNKNEPLPLEYGKDKGFVPVWGDPAKAEIDLLLSCTFKVENRI